MGGGEGEAAAGGRGNRQVTSLPSRTFILLYRNLGCLESLSRLPHFLK